MYVPGQQACSTPNGETPLPASFFEAARRRLAAVQLAATRAQQAVYGGCPSTAGTRGETALEILAAPSVQSAVSTAGLPSSSAPLCGGDVVPEVVPLSNFNPLPPLAPPLTPRPLVTPPVAVQPVKRGVVHVIPSPTAAYPEHATAIDDPTVSGPTVQFERAAYAKPYYDALGYDVVYSGGGIEGLPNWGDTVASGVKAASGWVAGHQGVVVAVLLLGAAAVVSNSSRSSGRASR